MFLPDLLQAHAPHLRSLQLNVKYRMYTLDPVLALIECTSRLVLSSFTIWIQCSAHLHVEKPYMAILALARALAAHNAGGCFQLRLSGAHRFPPPNFDTLRAHGWARAGDASRVTRYSGEDEVKVVIEDFAIPDGGSLRMESITKYGDLKVSLLHFSRSCRESGVH